MFNTHIDHKYIREIGRLFRNYKQQSQNKWNFSCPLCGDSKKNKFRARGYVFLYENNFLYKCWNCGVSLGFYDFLKEIDPNVAREYALEKFYNKDPQDFQSVSVDPVEPQEKHLEHVVPISTLEDTHVAVEYLRERQIPEEYFSGLFYAESFRSVVEEIDYEKSKSLRDEARIVIPFYDQKNKLIAFQGRSLNDYTIRYITIKVHEDSPKVYGLNKIDKTKRIYVTEGPFDSMFLSNSLAMAGSSINMKKLLGVKSKESVDIVFVYDNEPRNKEILNQMYKRIEEGHGIVIWSKEFQEKDINKMILTEELSRDTIDNQIPSMVYYGLEAKMKFIEWRKL